MQYKYHKPIDHNCSRELCSSFVGFIDGKATVWHFITEDPDLGTVCYKPSSTWRKMQRKMSDDIFFHWNRHWLIHEMFLSQKPLRRDEGIYRARTKGKDRGNSQQDPCLSIKDQDVGKNSDTESISCTVKIQRFHGKKLKSKSVELINGNRLMKLGRIDHKEKAPMIQE